MTTTIIKDATLECVIEQMEEKGYNMSEFDVNEAVQMGYFYAYMNGYQDADCYDIAEYNGLYTVTV